MGVLVLVVLQDSFKGVLMRLCWLILSNILHNGRSSRVAIDRAIHLLSVVLKVISVCDLLAQ